MGTVMTSGQARAAIGPRAGLSEVLRDSAYLALTKPRVTLMVLVTTLAGFYLGWRPTQVFDWVLLFHALAGTALIAGGTAGLNQVLEADADARMRRTRNRPLPAGRLSNESALRFTLLLMVAGALYLGILVNPLTAMLGLVTSASYLMLYTPLKRVSPMCTAIGAFPGAIPPLMGWTALRNEIDFQALAMFAVLFFWQFPHFYAIAWVYREDYERGGFRMLPIVDPQGHRTARRMLGYSLVLAAVSVLPFLLGLCGPFYLAAAAVLGLMMLRSALQAYRLRTTIAASGVMRASIIYLPLLLAAMAFDKL